VALIAVVLAKTEILPAQQGEKNRTAIRRHLHIMN
jgi:hypothetical protein